MHLGQVQLLYCSPLYNTFLKVRLSEQLRLANMSPGNRGDIISILMESEKVGAYDHYELIFAHIMDDDAKSLIKKLLLLWCTLRYDELLDEWSLKKDLGEDTICNDRACRKGWEG